MPDEELRLFWEKLRSSNLWCGAVREDVPFDDLWPSSVEDLKRIYAEAVAIEREACAKVCDEAGPHRSADHCAAKIRARAG